MVDINIEDFFRCNCNFVKFELSSGDISEKDFYGMFGSKQSRIFRDKSTDAFVKTMFNDIEKLNLFIDYCFYEIYSNTKSRINMMLYEQGIDCLEEDESINIIFKGGNIMSFFYNDIINILDKSASLKKNFVEIIDLCLKNNLIKVKDSEILEKLLINDLNLGEKNFKEINLITYLNDQKDNFKISDVDFSFVIFCNNEVKYRLIAQISGIIMINSLKSIKNFFNEYYKHNVITEQNSIKNLNESISFISHDNPDNKLIKLYSLRIKKFRKILNDINNKKEIWNTEINDIKNFYSDKYITNFIFNYAYPGNESYFNDGHEEHLNVTNLRLVIEIYEYLILKNIINKKKGILNEKEENILNMQIAGMEGIKLYHLNNKKIKIVQKGFYNINEINKIIETISSKYSLTNVTEEEREEAYKLYETRYENLRTFVDNIKTFSLERISNGPLNFVPYKKHFRINSKNEIDIIPRSDLILRYVNNYSVREVLSLESGTDNYHYITYNNLLNSQNNIAPVISFELYRIKFNIQLNNIIKINGKLGDLDVPSEFIDVSCSGFHDAARKHFVEDSHDNGLYIYKRNYENTSYYWNSYSLQQLFDDIFIVLFSMNTLIPWYDNKYNKRINRALLLYLLLNINKMKNENNIEKNMKWLKNLIWLLRLLFNIYDNIITNGQTNIYKSSYPYIFVSKFIINKKKGQYKNETIMRELSKYLLNLSIINLEKLSFNSSLYIDNRFKDFEYFIRFIIFYSYYMYDSDFLRILNIMRKKGNMREYTTQKEVNENNDKFIELLRISIKTLFIVIIIGMSNL